mgnify:CR=1 FL=1
MILTVNLGNTHITIGGYEHDDLKFCGRLHTDPAATVDEYGLRLLNLLSLHGASPEQIEGGILGSVVPALTGRVLAALQMLCPRIERSANSGVACACRIISAWTIPPSWVPNCSAARWPHWLRVLGLWWSFLLTQPSP